MRRRSDLTHSHVWSAAIASIQAVQRIRTGQTARVPRVLVLAAAGAAGALLRYGVAVALGVRTFPWATLTINLVGSFLLGVTSAVAADRGWSDDVTVPVAVGFLGAFTTFSTFSYETQLLLRGGRLGAAAAYVAASVAGGVLAAAVGYGVARSLR